MRIDGRVAICIPEWVTPEVPSFQMRCRACPNRVWVSTLMLSGVDQDGIAPVCLFCARRLVMRSEVTPIMSITRSQLRYFAENGLLETVYDNVSAVNESRAALVRHLDDMVHLISR